MPASKTSRKEILHKCWEVIHLNGYQASSISLLAKAAGLGKAGLLHHFGSKEELMKAVIEYSITFFHGYVFNVIEEDLPLEQRLEKFLRRQNRLSKLDQRGCFFTNLIMETGHSGLFNQYLSDFYVEWRAQLVRLLSHVMSETDAEEEVYQLLVQYEGAVALYKLSGDEEHLEKYVHRALRMLKQYTDVA